MDTPDIVTDAAGSIVELARLFGLDCLSKRLEILHCLSSNESARTDVENAIKAVALSETWIP